MSETSTEQPTEQAHAAESTEATETTTQTATAPEGNGTASSEEVRDPQKLLNAYNAEKEKRKAADTAQRELKTQLDALQAKIDGKEQEHAEQQKARETEAAALSKANERILKAEVRVAAASKLNDPADALRFLDLSEFEVGSDGDVDSAAITAAIDGLVKDKPYLAAQGRRFQGSADGGARNDGTRPTQLSKADLDRLSPEEIVKARKEGRCDDLLGIKS